MSLARKRHSRAFKVERVGWQDCATKSEAEEAPNRRIGA